MKWRKAAVPLWGLLACQYAATPPRTVPHAAPRLGPPVVIPTAPMTEPAPAAEMGPAAPESPAPSTEPAPVAAESPLDRLVAVGTLSLHLHCAGSGTPAVILEAGDELPGSDWRAVQPQLAQLTRTCSYDRAGTGYSSDAPAGRTADAVTEELHGLLEAAGVAPPYVLVGHSIGGLYVRQYARRYREQVAGLVLVEATPAEAMPSAAPRSAADHDRNFAARLAELRGARGSLGELPLVVLSRGKPLAVAGASPEAGSRLEQEWGQLQGELTWLSKNSVQSVADKGGHFLHRDAPGLVLAAVQTVVRAARSSAPLDLAAALRAARSAAR